MGTFIDRDTAPRQCTICKFISSLTLRCWGCNPLPCVACGVWLTYIPFSFWDRVPQCSLDWPQTWYTAQMPRTLDSPASASWGLALQMCTDLYHCTQCPVYIFKWQCILSLPKALFQSFLMISYDGVFGNYKIPMRNLEIQARSIDSH
jgi:hypothetical protein